jgi:hypothetical protein
MIIVPVELLEKIDRNRGQLSRAEFIDFCIDTLLQKGEELAPPGAAEGETVAPAESVSRQEFEEFRKRIKELQRAFIDFMVNWGLEPLERAPAEEQERFKEEVARLLQM